MKRKILLFSCLFSLVGFAQLASANTPQTDSSALAKKVTVLEKKVESQQKQIDELKTPNAPRKAVFVVERRGSKQLVKKNS